MTDVFQALGGLDRDAALRTINAKTDLIIQHLADTCPECQGTGMVFKPALRTDSPLFERDDAEELPCEACSKLRAALPTETT